MKLPEPARTLWREHQAAVRDVANAPGDESRVMIGGGTVLAARWGHRKSMDIDVLLAERESLSDAHEGGEYDLAARTGGRFEMGDPRRVKVRFEEGLLDVSAARPELGGLEEQVNLDGQEEIVLATAQILRGKLNRAEAGVTRDAFDICVAAAEEPRALEIAVNSVGRLDTRILTHSFERDNEAMTREARDEKTLSGVAEKYRGLLTDLGNNAARSIREHRYEHVRIATTELGVTIETRTVGGRSRREEHGRGHVHNALTTTGIGAYAAANTTVRPGALERTLTDLGKKRWKGTVFDSADRAPRERLEQARAAAGMAPDKPLRVTADHPT